MWAFASRLCLTGRVLAGTSSCPAPLLRLVAADSLDAHTIAARATRAFSASTSAPAVARPATDRGASAADVDDAWGGGPTSRAAAVSRPNPRTFRQLVGGRVHETAIAGERNPCFPALGATLGARQVVE